MSDSYVERLEADKVSRNALVRERAILDASELLCEHMEALNVSRADLAKKLGKTRSYVTQLLDGQNMTIATLASALDVLGRRLLIGAVPTNSVTRQVTSFTFPAGRPIGEFAIDVVVEEGVEPIAA